MGQGLSDVAKKAKDGLEEAYEDTKDAIKKATS